MGFSSDYFENSFQSLTFWMFLAVKNKFISFKLLRESDCCFGMKVVRIESKANRIVDRKNVVFVIFTPILDKSYVR
jgi:hypothetical protein